ncbi:MAG: hypothetical protein QW594_00615 [Candidatus Woesearchaeota archaeon]
MKTMKKNRIWKRSSWNSAQIFSLDVMIGIFVLITILLSAIWLWDTAREKIYLAESRNDLELSARNAIYSLLQSVGDPPNWHKLAVINQTTVHMIGIGKNRPWYIDEEKAKKLGQVNATSYEMLKTMLTIRGNEFYLNLSRFNQSAANKFTPIASIGKKPNSSAEQVVTIERFGLSDKNKAWVKIDFKVWKPCTGRYCS